MRIGGARYGRYSEGILSGCTDVCRKTCSVLRHIQHVSRDVLRGYSPGDSRTGGVSADHTGPGFSAVHRCGNAANVWNGTNVRVAGATYASELACGSITERSV